MDTFTKTNSDKSIIPKKGSSNFLFILFCLATFFIVIDYTRYILRHGFAQQLILCCCLIAWLSFFIFRYISTATNRKKAYIQVYISLVILFELERLVRYKMGIFPRYEDIPLLVHIALSLILAPFYLLAIDLLIKIVRLLTTKISSLMV